jgi:carbonic anhydrase
MCARSARTLVLVQLLAIPSVAAAQTFGYFGENGPSHWGTLSPAWVACGAGTIQSPVDFDKLAPHHPRWHRLDIDYDRNTAGEIFNNGHTIEVETEGANTLTLDNVPYELVQFHFHTASEHRVDRRGFDMELHLVHRAADGSNAVIGVFLKRGLTSGALAPIFAALPNDLDVHHPLGASFDPAAFLPRRRTHYRYLGSLTTPPCTEGVKWVVMSEPVTVSDEDMAQFAQRIHFNARPVQREARPSHGGGH